MGTPTPISMVDMGTPDYMKKIFCCAIAMAMPNCIDNVKVNISMVARNLKSGRKRHSRKLLQNQLFFTDGRLPQLLVLDHKPRGRFILAKSKGCRFIRESVDSL